MAFEEYLVWKYICRYTWDSVWGRQEKRITVDVSRFLFQPFEADICILGIVDDGEPFLPTAKDFSDISDKLLDTRCIPLQVVSSHF